MGHKDDFFQKDSPRVVPHPYPDGLAQNVFVEGPSKVALQEAVVIHSFGHDRPTNLK